MAFKGERALTLEWFTVTYRSVMAWIVGAVLLVAGAVGYWYVRYQYLPRSSASAAIATAEEGLRQAEPLADAQALKETLERAAAALDDARTAFRVRSYDDARFAALHSSDLSRQALEIAKGNSADTRMVRFYRIEGDVRVKHAGEFSWESASPKMVLNIGDQVKTSSSASAQLIYFDGTVTTIQPGSLLEIRDLYEDPVTKVRRVRQKLNFGEVQASTPARNVRGSYHEVATEKVAARAEKASEFRIVYNKEEKTTVVDTFTGQTQVSGQGKTESVYAGERLRAGASGALQGKESLPGVPRLLTPAAERVFVFEAADENKVALSWEAVPSANRYHLMISDRALFTSPLVDVARDGTNAVLEVGPGSYYWRVAALNSAGVEGAFSDPRGFRVSSQRIKDRDDNEPPALQVSEFVTIGMMVIMNGHCEPGATLWVDSEKIDVHDDGSFYAVVRLRKEGLNELQIRAQDAAGNETHETRVAYVELF